MPHIQGGHEVHEEVLMGNLPFECAMLRGEVVASLQIIGGDPMRPCILVVSDKICGTVYPCEGRVPMDVQITNDDTRVVVRRKVEQEHDGMGPTVRAILRVRRLRTVW